VNYRIEAGWIRAADDRNREHCHLARSFKSIVASRSPRETTANQNEVPQKSGIEKYRGKIREIL
jgi:hypothetical protein